MQKSSPRQAAENPEELVLEPGSSSLHTKHLADIPVHPPDQPSQDPQEGTGRELFKALAGMPAEAILWPKI